MNSDLLLAILKTSGALISGVLGLTALFSNFRDQSGHLNLAGKLVLAGILGSASVAATTSGLESINNFRSNQDQLARNEVLLRQINRAVQPISELRISLFATMPSDEPPVSEYVKRLDEGIKQRANDLQRFPPEKTTYEGLSVSSTNSSHDILDVSIEPESDLWPHLPNETTIDNVVKFGSPSISLLRTPVSADEYPLTHGDADLSAWGLPIADNASLLWNFQEKELQIHSRVEYQKDLWSASGELTSFDDLLGSQLALILPYDDPEFLNRLTGHSVENAEIYRVGRTLHLHWVSLELGAGRSLVITGKHFKKSFSKLTGQPVFVVTLPDTREELDQLSK